MAGQEIKERLGCVSTTDMGSILNKVNQLNQVNEMPISLKLYSMSLPEPHIVFCLGYLGDLLHE